MRHSLEGRGQGSLPAEVGKRSLFRDSLQGEIVGARAA